jgi:hypothetical protein
MLHRLYSHARVPEVALCAFPSRADNINTLFEKGINSSVRITFIGLRIPPNEGF